MNARPINPEEHHAYEALAQEHGSLFLQKEWTSLFGEDLIRVGLLDDNGEIQGGFQLYRERRFGLTIVRNAPYTPEAGPFLRIRAEHPVAVLEARREAVAAMASYLRRHKPALTYLSLSRDIFDGLPLRWAGFRVVNDYTYVLDLSLPLEVLEARLTTTRRRNISKALRDGLVARRIDEPALMRRLVLGSMDHAGVDAKTPHLDRILQKYALLPNAYAFAAFRDPDPLASVFVVHDSHTAYYLLGGTVREGGHHGAASLAMWEAIRHAREVGISTFDFEGSVIPPIERYLRGFGGSLTPYLTIVRGWWPIEVALNSWRRGEF